MLRDAAPVAGDLVLARVAELGQHQKLESPDGRRTSLYEGEEVIVVYGARYPADAARRKRAASKGV